MVAIKICGLTTVEQALQCIDAGADALGLNFWPASSRRCEDPVAAQIVTAVGDRARIVAVVVDAAPERLRALRQLGLQWFQFHGAESGAEVARWLPYAYKAIHLGGSAEPSPASFPGDEILVDAKVDGLPGGTGVRCDWVAAEALARRRKLWLAGGLDPDNVASAIEVVRPYGVDVASGVESRPGVKDLKKVARFIANARGAR